MIRDVNEEAGHTEDRRLVCQQSVKGVKWEEVTGPHCLFGGLYGNTEKSEMGKRTALGVLLIYYLTLESHDC